MKEPEILIKKYRGETIESQFRAHLVVVENNGQILKSIGDPNHSTYIRSASKPFQTVPLITTGAFEAFGLSEKHLAVSSGSHNGQKINTDVVSDMLYRGRLSEENLGCGIHAPFTRLAKEEIGNNISPKNNNCSGKHASMLLICKHMGWEINDYMNPEHPVQQLMKDTVSNICEFESKKMKIGIDGCGVPVFAMPIFNMAIGFRNLIHPEKVMQKEYQKPISQIVNSIQKYPDIYAGSDRIATAFIKDNQTSIFKAGAEGVGCFGLPDKAIAFKLECGDEGKLYQFLTYKIAEKYGCNISSMNAWGIPDIFSNSGKKVGEMVISDELWG